MQQVAILSNSLLERQRILLVWLERHLAWQDFKPQSGWLPVGVDDDVKVKRGLLRKMSIPKGLKEVPLHAPIT